MKPDLILVGGGGHCHSVIDAVEEADVFRIAGIVDVKEKIGSEVLGYQVIGSDEDLERLIRKNTFFLVAVGQIKSAETRVSIYDKLKKLNAPVASIISPYAHVSKHAHISPGTVVLHGATVNAGAEIGENCIINSHALIEHDAVIGSHCHISTGAIVNGGASVGDKTFIGSGAVILQEVEVGKGCVVGAGSVVLNTIGPGMVHNPSDNR